jgi:hypothetical protein
VFTFISLDLRRLSGNTRGSCSGGNGIKAAEKGRQQVDGCKQVISPCRRSAGIRAGRARDVAVQVAFEKAKAGNQFLT